MASLESTRGVASTAKRRSGLPQAVARAVAAVVGAVVVLALLTATPVRAGAAAPGSPGAPSAALAAPALSAPGLAAPVLAMVPPVAFIENLLGGAGTITSVVDDFEDVLNDVDDDFQTAGEILFWALFLAQLLMISIRMVTGGSGGSLFKNPIIDLAYYIAAALVVWIIVDNAGLIIQETYDLFKGVGRVVNGCQINDDDCVDPNNFLLFAFKVASYFFQGAGSSGMGSSAGMPWYLQIVGSALVPLVAYATIAVQIAVTDIVFLIARVMAPFFMATIIFKPFSGLASGYFKLIMFLAVKILILYIIAAVAKTIGVNWEGMLISLAAGFITGQPQVAELVMNAFGVVGPGLVLLTLATTLPNRVSKMISWRLSIDFNKTLGLGKL